MALSTVLILAGVVAGFAGVFASRGALDVLFGSVGLAITGVIGVVSGAVLASMAARARIDSRP